MTFLSSQRNYNKLDRLENRQGKAQSQQILSKEDWEVHETESPLWNLLWSWLIDDDGKNILQNQDGSERFPDFDLYNHISQHVHCAKPQEQIFKDIFSSYKVKEVGDWETVYPLFC